MCLDYLAPIYVFAPRAVIRLNLQKHKPMLGKLDYNPLIGAKCETDPCSMHQDM
jgi:hypothetical protein